MDYNNHDWGSYVSSVELKAVPVTGNEGYLQDTPHIVQGDIAAVCVMNLGENAEGMMTAKVTDAILGGMGISQEELFKTAMENSRNKSPVHIASMDKMMEAIMTGAPMFESGGDILDEIRECSDIEDLEVGMFVISNEKQVTLLITLYGQDYKEEIPKDAILDILKEHLPGKDDGQQFEEINSSEGDTWQ